MLQRSPPVAGTGRCRQSRLHSRWSWAGSTAPGSREQGAGSRGRAAGGSTGDRSESQGAACGGGLRGSWGVRHSLESHVLPWCGQKGWGAEGGSTTTCWEGSREVSAEDTEHCEVVDGGTVTYLNITFLIFISFHISHFSVIQRSVWVDVQSILRPVL